MIKKLISNYKNEYYSLKANFPKKYKIMLLRNWSLRAAFLFGVIWLLLFIITLTIKANAANTDYVSGGSMIRTENGYYKINEGRFVLNSAVVDGANVVNIYTEGARGIYFYKYSGSSSPQDDYYFADYVWSAHDVTVCYGNVEYLRCDADAVNFNNYLYNTPSFFPALTDEYLYENSVLYPEFTSYMYFLNVDGTVMCCNGAFIPLSGNRTLYPVNGLCEFYRWNDTMRVWVQESARYYDIETIYYVTGAVHFISQDNISFTDYIIDNGSSSEYVLNALSALVNFYNGFFEEGAFDLFEIVSGLIDEYKTYTLYLSDLTESVPSKTYFNFYPINPFNYVFEPEATPSPSPTVVPATATPVPTATSVPTATPAPTVFPLPDFQSFDDVTDFVSNSDLVTGFIEYAFDVSNRYFQPYLNNKSLSSMIVLCQVNYEWGTGQTSFNKDFLSFSFYFYTSIPSEDYFIVNSMPNNQFTFYPFYNGVSALTLRLDAYSNVDYSSSINRPINQALNDCYNVSFYNNSFNIGYYAFYTGNDYFNYYYAIPDNLLLLGNWTKLGDTPIVTVVPTSVPEEPTPTQDVYLPIGSSGNFDITETGSFFNKQFLNIDGLEVVGSFIPSDIKNIFGITIVCIVVAAFVIYFKNYD